MKTSAAKRGSDDRNPAGTTRPVERYRSIVKHFEEIARANINQYVHVANLSRIAGINQRTLSRAFREVRGVGPYRYLQYLRLSEVKKRLLLSAEDRTITQVAMQYGFRELGKFGVLYRKVFGESPSETRRKPMLDPLVSACVELPMSAGNADNLFLNLNGGIALVECKLWRNPEARRKVVAQVIDYARCLTTWRYTDLELAVSHACGDS